MLFDSVVPSMEGRVGGYTRILKIGTRRGDAAETCLLQWVVIPAKAVVEPVVAEAVAKKA
jgi:large subunit ribosomal protein L17